MISLRYPYRAYHDDQWKALHTNQRLSCDYKQEEMSVMTFQEEKRHWYGRWMGGVWFSSEFDSIMLCECLLMSSHDWKGFVKKWDSKENFSLYNGWAMQLFVALLKIGYCHKNKGKKSSIKDKCTFIYKVERALQNGLSRKIESESFFVAQQHVACRLNNVCAVWGDIWDWTQEPGLWKTIMTWTYSRNVLFMTK